MTLYRLVKDAGDIYDSADLKDADNPVLLWSNDWGHLFFLLEMLEDEGLAPCSLATLVNRIDAYNKGMDPEDDYPSEMPAKPEEVLAALEQAKTLGMVEFIDTQ